MFLYVVLCLSRFNDYFKLICKVNLFEDLVHLHSKIFYPQVITFFLIFIVRILNLTIYSENTKFNNFI